MAKPDARKPDVVYIAINQAGGGVAIMAFIVTEYRPTSDEEKEEFGDRVVSRHTDPTPENINKEIAKSSFGWLPEEMPVSWKIIPFSDIPTDRTFRNAWKHNGNAFETDMPKAREIARQHFRYKGDNASANSVAITNAQTPEALKALMV